METKNTFSSQILFGEDDPGFGVYIHWPFCLAKCPYCDFNSHVRHQPIDEKRFCKALVRELEWFAAHTPASKVKSVFFGGGTPSLMSPDTVAALLERIGELFGWVPRCEITLEANPTSVETSRFDGFRQSGINRISLGIQSLNDDALKRLGRQHDAKEARAALAIAQETFERVSVDLIYARPGQTCEDWAIELSEAIALSTCHLSLYQLTIEPDTRYFDLHRLGKLIIPDDDLAADLYMTTQEICDAASLPAYEISNHAQPGEECRHNLLYWQSGSWAGIGPGAHSRVWDSAGGRHALSGERHPETWLTRTETVGHGLTEDTMLSARDIAHEMMLMAMRTSLGLNLDRFSRIGAVLDEGALGELQKEGLVEVRAGNSAIVLTSTGRLVANSVIAALIGPCLNISATPEENPSSHGFASNGHRLI
jgi:putative oxygen-independent coproporphyrinogen III oxidase